jgi:hypothetical protein
VTRTVKFLSPVAFSLLVSDVIVGTIRLGTRPFRDGMPFSVDIGKMVYQHIQHIFASKCFALAIIVTMVKSLKVLLAVLFLEGLWRWFLFLFLPLTAFYVWLAYVDADGSTFEKRLSKRIGCFRHGSILGLSIHFAASVSRYQLYVFWQRFDCLALLSGCPSVRTSL